MLPSLILLIPPPPAPSRMTEEFDLSADPQMLRQQVVALRRKLAEAQRRHEDERDRRKRTERDLRDSEAIYHSLVQNLPVSLIRKDLEGRITFANEPVCRELGRDLSDLIGKTDFDFWPHELAEKYRADDRRVIETQEVFEDVESHRTPQGDWRHVHVLKAPVVDSEGEVVAVQAVFWDVTDRRRAEEELKTSEARKRAIFETSLDCLIISDEAGRIVEFNRAAEHTFGYKRDEVLGHDMNELLFASSMRLLPTTSADRSVSPADDGLLLGKRLEVPLVRRGGETFIAEMAMQPIPLEGTVHFATVLHDITSRKKQEAELQQAKEAAEAASQAKSAFLANMSHEIRTPMNAILGMTGLVLDSDIPAEQREQLLIVKDSAESLLSLINDILDFSKIEAGRLDLNEHPFRLRDRLGDTMRSLSIRAHDKGLELACHISPNVPDNLIGDVGRLRQVVINLVGNAIKFTEQGEVVLDVDVEQQSEKQATLHLQVQDTGIGIPADRHVGIFEAFEQLDSSTTRRFGGTGLGLAISQKLVHLMGGRIWVQSQPGAGSTFHFTARFELADGPPTVVSRQALQSLRGLLVLVVDDNATNRVILEEMLVNWGMRVRVAGSAAEAEKLISIAREQQQPYQLLLTDVHMPERDGFQLVEQLRHSADLSDLRIVLLTSGDHPDDLARCRALRVSRYMAKPVKQSELLEAIGEAFGVPVIIGAEGDRQSREAHVTGRNILLVEDSVPNQKLAQGLLRKFQHHVTVANDGVEALKAWKSQPFDLILMDVQMPHMDGLEATRLIRKREAALNRRIPIIAMTAHAMKGDEELCLEAGMDAYVAKPIRPSELYDAIDRMVAPDDAAQATNALDVSDNGPTLSGIDWNAALGAVQHDEELLREVVEAVLEEVPRLMDQLNAALERGDTATGQRMAHTIKGDLRTFQAQPAIDTAEALERSCKDGLLEEAHNLSRQLAPDIDQFLTELVRSPYAPSP